MSKFSIFNFQFSTKKGQSLVEVVLSVAVVTLVVTALTVLGISAVRSADAAKKKSSAAKLANQGVELVRVCRDRSGSWSSFLTDCDEPSEIGWSLLSGLSGTLGVSEVVSGKAQVIVSVSFTDSQGTHATTAESYLTDWR